MNTPKTQTHNGITFTWQTLKGVDSGALIGTGDGLWGPKANITGYKIVALFDTGGRSGRTIEFTDGSRKWGGVATKYWVAAPVADGGVRTPTKAPRAARIPADASTFVCASCGTDKPVTAFPTVTGPADRATTCRPCRSR